MATVDKNIQKAIENSRKRIEKISSDILNNTGSISVEEANKQISVINQFMTDLSNNKIEVRNGKYYYPNGLQIMLGNDKLNNPDQIYSLATVAPNSERREELRNARLAELAQTTDVANVTEDQPISDVPTGGVDVLGGVVSGITAIGNVANRVRTDLNEAERNAQNAITSVITEGGYSSLPANPLPLSPSTPRNIGGSVANTRAERPVTTSVLTPSPNTQYTGGAGIAGELLVGGGSAQPTGNSVVVNQSAQAVETATPSTTVTGQISTQPRTTTASNPRVTWQVGNGVSGIEGDIKGFQNMYNRYATGAGLPTIDEDGIYGKQTDAAVTVWNENNPGSKINVDSYTVNQTDLNTTKNYIKSLGLDNAMGLPPTVFDPLAQPIGYDRKTGKALYGDSSTTVIGLAVDPITGNYITTPGREGDNVFDKLAENIKKTTPVTTKSYDGVPDKDRRYNWTSRLGDLTDVTTGVIGAMMASKTIPEYEKPPEYLDALQTLKEQSQQGFTATEQAAIDQRIDNRYAQDVNTITQVAGGGGNQAAVLGALNTASRNAQTSEVDAALKDIELQRQNQSRYINALSNDMNFDYGLYQQDLNMGLQQRQAGADLIYQSRQNISNRGYYDRMYGPGSVYEQVNNTIRNNTTASAQAEQQALTGYYNSIGNNATIGAPVMAQPSTGRPLGQLSPSEVIALGLDVNRLTR